VKVPVRKCVFPGSDQERSDMIAAVRRHCACLPGDIEPGSVTVITDPCSPHDLLGQDDTLKRLVFYRRWHRARGRAV
jgi:hypothetical protein